MSNCIFYLFVDEFEYEWNPPVSPLDDFQLDFLHEAFVRRILDALETNNPVVITAGWLCKNHGKTVHYKRAVTRADIMLLIPDYADDQMDAISNLALECVMELDECLEKYDAFCMWGDWWNFWVKIPYKWFYGGKN